MLRILPWPVLLLLLFAGCSDSPSAGSPTDNSADSAAAGTAAAEQDSKATADSAAEKSDEESADVAWPPPPARPRTALPGNWVLELHIPASGYLLPTALVQVSEGDDGSFAATSIDSPPQVEQTTVASAQLSGNTANLVIELSNPQIPITKVDFQGELKDGIILGNALLGNGNCTPARLVATDEEKFPETIQPQPVLFAGEIETLAQGFQENPTVGVFRGFAEKHPETPLALLACHLELLQSKILGATTEEVQKTAEVYLSTAKRWGTRNETYTALQIGQILTSQRNQPEIALEHLKLAESRLSEGSPEAWKQLLDDTLRQARANVALVRMNSEDPEVVKQAVEEIRQLQKQQPYNHLILYALADYARRQQQTDEAISWYAQLVVAPMLESALLQEWDADDVDNPLPGETLARLWKEKHGSTEGLDEFLDEMYETTIYAFLKDLPQTAVESNGNRTVLCELFTGARCPPCVAADVSTGALEKTIPREDLVILRYHQHVPGPDPLTSQDSEARFHGYYQLQGTPSVILNGRPFPAGGGFMQHAADVFQQLRDAITPLLKETTDVVLQLSADADGENLNLSAAVSGLEATSPNLRLRLILAEDDIHFEASNGIRRHEMVVRTMPGGPSGVKPKEGKLEFSESISLEDFKNELVDYLAAYEEGNNWQFSAKPLALDRLYLVAFVQDDDTGEVLQVATVPVTGELKFPESSEPAPPKTEPDEPQDAAEGAKPVE